MPRLKTIPTQSPNAELQYANWLQQLILMIKPKNLGLIAGRGTGKTTGIMAPRFMDISEEMPGCYMAVSSDTFMNARKNIIPSLMDGWKMNGWIDEYHYIVNRRAPSHFGKPYKPPIEWKDSITDFRGTHYKIISQDRPSGGAGDSYQHVGGDEVKYQAEKKINKLTPAVRGGELKFRKSPYYGGRTFFTDMPNPNHGEHDWILRMKKNMNPEQIKLMYWAAWEINSIILEMHKSEQEGNYKQAERILKKLERWEEKFAKLRKNSTFFYIASSFVNVDFLGYDYFKEQLETMVFSDVASSILSLSPKLEKGQQFYPNLSQANFYKDGYIYDRIDSIDMREKIEDLSIDLKHILPKRPIEGGLDTGNMCSLVTGQDHGHVNRIYKEFYTLAPDFLEELAEKFRNFYAHHKEKHLLLWHDRATNNWQKVNQDHATKFKHAIEYDKKGNATGWTVTLMSRNQETIYQQQEYELALKMLEGDYKGLPKVLIDQNGCPCLKSSMERAEKIVKVNIKGQKSIHKDKSSEKLPMEELPLKSTNMSDGFKYYICRDEYLNKIKGRQSSFSGLPRSN